MRRLFLTVVLCCGGMLASCGGASSAGEETKDSAGTRLVVDLPLTDSMPDPMGRQGGADTIEMGRIREGEVIEGEFMLRNVGEKPLVVVQIITGCGCTTADYDPAPIAPGNSRRVKWRFDSRGRFGQQFKSIEVITAERQCATVYLRGEVAAE